MAHNIGTLGLQIIDDTDNVSPGTINANTEIINDLFTSVHNELGTTLKTNNLISNNIFMTKEWLWTDPASYIGQNKGWTKNIGITGYTPISISYWGLGNGWGSNLVDLGLNNMMSTDHKNHTLSFWIECRAGLAWFKCVLLYIKNDNVL